MSDNAVVPDNLKAITISDNKPVVKEHKGKGRRRAIFTNKTALPQPTLSDSQALEAIDKMDILPFYRACEETGLDRCEVMRRISESAMLSQLYTIKKKMFAQLCAESTIAIADDASVEPAVTRNKIGARQWMAERYDPDTYSVRQKIDLTPVLQKPVAYDLSKLSPEELEQLRILKEKSSLQDQSVNV